jgi:hypothetical protein
MVDTFLWFAQNSFENPGKLSTKRKKEIKIQKRILPVLDENG